MRNAILFLSVLFVFGCSSSKKTTESTTDETPTIDGIEVREVLTIESFKDFNVTRDFTITSTEIDGDILKVGVVYSGGCAEHYFNMYTNMKYMKSLPPKLNMILVHDKNGDACREVKSETLLFDIKQLKYEGQSKLQLVLNSEYLVDYNY